AERDSVRSGEAVGHQQVADSSSPDTEGCGRQAAVDTVSAHEGPRLYPPLPSPVGDRHGTPGPPAGTASLAVGSEAGPPARRLVRLCVLRISTGPCAGSLRLRSEAALLPWPPPGPGAGRERRWPPGRPRSGSPPRPVPH